MMSFPDSIKYLLIAAKFEKGPNMNDLETGIRQQIIEAGHRLLESGLIARTWGNISARLSDTEFIITPSGRAYDTLRPEELVKCRIADCSYEGTNKPSSEKGIHADAYRLRKDINFVIHTHQFYATAVGVTGKSIRNPFIPCASYGMPSTGRLRNAVATTVRSNPENKSFLMTKHGALCLGTDIEDAFIEALKLEEICEKLFFKRVKLERTNPLGEKKYVIEGSILVNDPEIMAIAKRGSKFRPPIDDLVQIGGTVINCVESNPEVIKKSVSAKHPIVLVKNVGAICIGEDREAMHMILKKGCAALLYAGEEKCSLNPLDAAIQRMVYVRKYSKRK